MGAVLMNVWFLLFSQRTTPPLLWTAAAQRSEAAALGVEAKRCPVARPSTFAPRSRRLQPAPHLSPFINAKTPGRNVPPRSSPHLRLPCALALNSSQGTVGHDVRSAPFHSQPVSMGQPSGPTCSRHSIHAQVPQHTQPSQRHPAYRSRPVPSLHSKLLPMQREYLVHKPSRPQHHPVRHVPQS